MNEASIKPAFRSCPSCGAALNSGAVVCQSCGGLIVVESFFQRLRGEIKYQIAHVSDRLRNRQTLLWVLALCPIVILPPLLAIFMSFRSQTDTEAGRSPDVPVLIVAVCNVILSVMFWRWIGDTALSMGFSIGLFLKSLGITHPTATGLRSI